MRIEEIRAAMNEGIPFEIETAAGRKFVVTDRERIIIAPGRGAAIILTEDELVHIVPFLTMTSLAYLYPTK